MEKIISVFLLLTNVGFFPVHIEGFYNFVSCTTFHPFFRHHFLKIPIIHNVYCLNRSSQHQSIDFPVSSLIHCKRDDLLPVHCI